MKNQKGITLVSLVIYVVVMLIVIGAMSSIVNNFYKNMDTMQGNVEEIVEFNKFNNYFLKEVKIKDNGVDNVTNNYILFTSGNSFSISNNVIYYNNIEVCRGVQGMEITLGKDGDGEDNTIVNVNITFSNFSKSISYKIEEIY